jgi:NAD(P)-dependent dehydrogenase (short-subunit alcohol dehydrogenase family)
MTRKRTAQKLQGQVAIVTGAGRGIGQATAELLAASGAAVVLTARSADAIEATAAQIRQSGGRAIGVAADVSDPDAVEEVVESAIDQFDRVDILVNNAGIIWPLDEFVESDPDEWSYNIQVNLLGPYYITRNVLPLMMDQDYGRIVHVSSGAARRAFAGWSAYCVAKAGLDMMSSALALELQGTRITSNCFYPGLVDTEMQSDIRSVDTSESSLDFSLWQNAYERDELRTPADVARYIYWLVGPWSAAVSGQVFDVRDEEWAARVHADLGGQIVENKGSEPQEGKKANGLSTH